MSTKELLNSMAEAVADAFNITPYQVMQHEEARRVICLHLQTRYKTLAPASVIAEHFGVTEATIYSSANIMRRKLSEERKSRGW